MATATGIGGSMGLSQPVMIRTEYVKCEDEVLWVYVYNIVNQLSAYQYVLCTAALGSYPIASDNAIGTLTHTIVQLDSVKSKMQQPKESVYEVIKLSVRN